jgi:hypothetical protein
LRTIAEDGLHLDAVVHEHHAAGFGHRGFHRIEFHFDKLHVIPVNRVINFVHCWHKYLS